MAAVTPNTNQAHAMRVAVKRIEGFTKQFGETHRNLARHAAFPFVLTPDLLYQIWANFVPEAPWTAVAHVLLSRLCRQVGYEMYEMDICDRNLLLRELKEQFGQERFDELGEFLLDYVAQRLTEDDADTDDLAEAQEWTALAYTKPGEVARELAEALSLRVKQQDMTEVLRLASLVETFAEPLAQSGFEPLLIYADGMATFVRGNRKGAAARFAKLPLQEHQIEIAEVSLDIPLEEQSVLQIAETQNHQKFPAIVTEISDDDRAKSDKKYPLSYLNKTPRSRISHLRKKRGITQTELARSWGVSNVTVQSWEKETSKAHHLVHLVLMCHLLSCTPRDLVSYLPASTLGSNRIKNLDRIRQQVSQEDHSASDNSPLPVTRIAELRESKGLTQSQLADALDVSVHTIQNWESGRTSGWQFVQFIKLCDILDCTPRELVYNIPPERISAVEELLQNKSKIGVYEEQAQQKQLAQNIESEDILDCKSQS